MDVAAQEFLTGIGRGPAVLLLGQRYLALQSDGDPFLKQIATKYDAPEVQHYSDLFELDLLPNADAALAWMDERCRRIAPPEYLEGLADYPWSSVVSSAIDTVWPAALRRPWREVQPVFDDRHRPSDPRNRSRLHCLFLYGNVNRSDPSERVPLSRFERLKRDQVAIALARRIPDLVTPLGTLAVEGYAGAGDWLQPDHLAPILADLNESQVHFFGVDESIESDPVLRELYRLGIAVTHRATLAQTLSEGASAGIIKYGPVDAGGDLHQIRLGETAARVPSKLWNRVRTSATVLDDAVLAPPRPVSADARYRDFRTFLGAGDGVPDWDGLGRGFAFRRQFETELRTSVEKALGSPGFQELPIVLHGPTGSGKTIALAVLARDIRLQHKYPVLFVERRAQPPAFGDLDLFCEWAEQEGATATLIAWDGMLASGDYHDALRYLGSRGRNVVVVGTSYRMPTDERTGRRYVHAPAQLANIERDAFLAFLRGFDAGLDELVSRHRVIADEAFLVALYRLLPPVRGVVRAGVAREVRHAERSIAESAQTTELEYRPRNALARAMAEAGLIQTDGLTAEATREVGSELVDDFQHLTGLVMIPGRFGLRVPLELLLRALGHEGFTHFIQLLNGVDIFRWFEDAAGNIEIGARSRLEAGLIADARAGGPETEIALARELLLETGPDDHSWGGGREVDFGVALLRAIGPSGEQAGTYAAHFDVLADTLCELRIERGVYNARLMLQEANLRRELAVDESKRREPDFALIDDALDAAETVVREALELLPDEPRSRGMRSTLLVELASTMGTRSTQLIKQNGRSNAEAHALVLSLREVVARARREDPTSYYPVDVLAWATRNAIDGGLLSGEEKLEAISDVMSAFQATEIEELEPSQINRFHARRFEMGDMIGDDDLSSDAEHALRQRGSGAALFMRALRASGLVSSPDQHYQPDPEQLAAAVAILEGDEDLLWGDSRCLDLYLELWWLVNTGARLFSGERHAPPLTREQWTRFLSIVDALEEQDSPRRPTVLGFLRGLAQFHLDRVADALSTFKEVERQSMAVRSRRRVIRTYVASTPDGTPRTYHGTISWLDPSARKGDVRVEELRASIVFFTHDFRMDDPHIALDIGDFHIAFNFLGPIADPVIFKSQR